MNKKNFFVTGAEGFIGSHLVEKLLEKNYKVVALVLYNSFGYKGWLDDIKQKRSKNLTIKFGDIRDFNLIKDAMKGCETVIHLASLVGIPYSFQATESYVDVNVKGTLNLLNAAKDNKIKRFIHTSTSEVYGTAQKIPIDENHPLVGQSPYAASKIAADQMVNAFNKSYGIKTITLRPFNTFGPRQSLRAVIPTIISQLLNSNIVKIGNIKSTRDFTYIDDTIDAYIKSINFSSVNSGEIINLGTGFEISISEIIEIVGSILNIKPKIIIDKDRYRPNKSEVDRLVSNNNKAKKLLNWIPQCKNKKNFREYLKKNIDWYKKNKNLNKLNFLKYNI